MAMMGYEKRKILENTVESIMKRNNINLKKATTLLFSSKTYEDFVNNNITEISSESLMENFLLECDLNENTSSINIDIYSYIACIDGYVDFFKIPAKDVITLFNKHDILNVLDNNFMTLEGEYHTAQRINDVILSNENN